MCSFSRPINFGGLMRIVVGLPSRVASATGELMLEWATRADQGPFSSVVVTDRVVSTALEPLTVLAMAAGATRRVRLMTSVVIGPTRETTLLARQAATIDLLSGGRLTLGLGIGVRENDYQATGFDFHRRGRRVEEQLPVLRRLWVGERLSDEMGPIVVNAIRRTGTAHRRLRAGGGAPHCPVGRRLYGARRRRAREHDGDVEADQQVVERIRTAGTAA